MGLSGMGESMCFEGATDAAAFEVYVEHFLAPSLCEGQVVVMDNLGAHQPKRIRELIEARGAELVRSEEHTSELQSRQYLVCRLLLEKKQRSPLAQKHPHGQWSAS